ncbi:Crp/Fnr family transcriptional regulator [Paraburkholderia strydomiana]|uniref:Crp/Fnr family transcriptional regulator n=1 Tax=Paraburkholderia strydomiana TaxID=1245417 RepID=UPI0038B6D9F2
MWFVGKSELLSLIQCHCLDEVMPAFSDHRTLRKNTVIYRPDESSEHVYLLKSGSVRLYRLTEDGQEITLAFVKAGMIFGDGDVLNEDNYSHHAQALTPSMVCYIRKADFKELLARYDVINQFVLRNHYLRWQEAQQLIENLSLHDVRKRLVNILVMFSGQVGTPFDHPEHGDTVLIDLPIAQDKLAEFIGTSRESVNRHFSDLKSEGFVDMHERKIVLTPAFVARYITKAPSFAALPANPAPREFRAPLMRA